MHNKASQLHLTVSRTGILNHMFHGDRDSVLFTSDPEPHQTHSGHSVLEEGVVDGCSAQKDGGTETEAVTHSECAGGQPDRALGPAFEFYET